jgi:glycerol-3-phosphate dehydrogenase
MNRDEMLDRLARRGVPWDFAIIGGGATGVGIAVDAASRGYDVVLLEQSDFGKGTSSRSTKLVHGGVRYLQQGNVPLVMEALKERGILRANAPHLVHDLPFIVPNYQWWEAPFYGIGMRVYDALAGKYGFGASRNLSKEETIEALPTIETDGLRGGVVYHDGQFDDARLLIDMAETAAEQGAVLVNYARVTRLTKGADGFLDGVIALDVETGAEIHLEAKVVINATGVFSDDVRAMDDATAPALIRPSQGVHVVLDRSFLPGDSAIMVPHTDDGRVLFAIPWLDRVLIGTTDTPVESISLEPVAQDEEVEFILHHAARYLTRDPTRADVLSVFAGLRPLVRGGGAETDTSHLSREHTVLVSKSGLLSIAGG